MREIKFRGLTANGTWVYGDIHRDTPNETLYYQEYSQRICWNEGTKHCNAPIKNGTEGQYTGLKDKNGKEIYEGDIVKARSKRVNCVYEVYWEERGCQFRCCAHRDRQFDKTHLMDWADEVIGNIYENPELLNTKP